MTSFSSPITELNKYIESQNPFDRSLIVRSHDIWKQSFPDVPAINAHASDAVFQAIAQIRAGHRPVVGITIKAEKGLGKSHLISRIRQRLQTEGESFFVYMSEVDYSDLDRINSKFLNTLAFSLKQTGSQGVMQWQELATALVNEAFGKTYTPQQLINQLPGALAKNSKVIEQLTTKLINLKPNIENPYLIQAILWTLSLDKAVFAINWLSGKELAKSQADAMGLPNPKEEDKETESFQTACQILDLVGDYRTIVIGFDELESVDCNAVGFTRAQVVALLAKDLYSKIKRGVLIMPMFAQTWTHQVKALPQAESVTSRVAEKSFDLKYLNPDDVVLLVSEWLKDFYHKKGLTPPHPVYPFNETELRELGQERPIVRRVLQWCADNWKTGKEAPKRLHKVEVAFNEQMLALGEKIDDYLEDNSTLADALRLGFLAIRGETIEKVKIEQIEEVQAKGADKGYLHFRVVGKEDDKVVKIVVAVVQNSGGKFVSAALKRLIDYKKFDMTRGCLIRSKEVNSWTKGKEYLDKLLQDLGGELVTLKSEDIKPLLAILLVNKSRSEYEITEEEILEFMIENKVANTNYLIQEILSDPSGQIPTDLVNEDIVENYQITEMNDPENINTLIDNLLTRINY